jgi:glycosyltransferase involved in cell wall biosynthesis
MATYNGSQFILKQIQSILVQLREHDELIISDDGSSDGTIEIIQGIKEHRIKLIHHEFKGKKPKVCASSFFATSNFENALKNVSGDFIFFSDQDDIWASDKVVKTIKLLKNNPDNVVISTLNVIDKNDKIIQKNKKQKTPTFWKGLQKCKYHGGAMAFDINFLARVLPFPKYVVSHDNWIGLLATFQGRLLFLNEPLLLYRRHGTNVTWDVKNPLWFKVFYRIYYFYAILKRSYL